MEKEYNITLIKGMLIDELNKNNESLKQIKSIKSEISFIDETLKLTESKDFENIKNNYLMIDNIIDCYFDKNTKNKFKNNKLFNSICICNNYSKNSEKYLEEEFLYAERIISIFNNELKKISENYKEKLLKTKPYLSEYISTNYKIIIKKFKNNEIINNDNYNTLVDVFKKRDLTNKEIIMLLEKIREHNIRCHYKNGKVPNTKSFKEINGIINSGAEEFDNVTWISSDRKKQIDDLINSIKKQKNIDEIIIDMLPSYNGNLTFTDNYTKSEVTYLYTSLLKHFQNELYEIQEYLSSIDYYRDKELREMLVKDYKNNLISYKLLRNKFDTELDKYNNDLNKAKEENDVIKLHYGLKDSGITFFESDLKNMPKDTYKSILELLIKFKKGKLAPQQQKQLNEAFPGNMEIRDDQIRIIYRHINNNEYVIIGTFLKKDDNPKNEYKRICRRDFSSAFDDDIVEENLINLINEKSHNGGRRNTR